VAERHVSMSSSTSFHTRSPSNIRFSDVANYVGLSLTRDPQQLKATPVKRRQPVLAPGERPLSNGGSPKADQSGELRRADTLPTIQANRAERLRCQMEWLKAEQRAEKEQLHRLESSLSDSLLLEKKAQKRVAKHKEMRDFHSQRVQDVETKISMLKGELEAPRGGEVQTTAGNRQPRPKPERVTVVVEPQRQGVVHHNEPPPEPVVEESPEERPERILPPLEAVTEEIRQVAAGSDDRRAVSPDGEQSFGSSRQASAREPTAIKKSVSVYSESECSVPRRKSNQSSVEENTTRRRSDRDRKADNSQPQEEAPNSDEEGEGAVEAKSRSAPTTPNPKPSGGPWIKQYLNFDSMAGNRSAKWQPSTPEEKIQMLLQAADLRSEGTAKKRWMSSTFRRLKTRGKSDARCREVVALHLPRGSGPKDREDVPIFSQNEVRSCKKIYTDQYMEPVKRIQKVIVNMKDQKRELRAVREDLYMVTEARLVQQRAEEDRKNAVASISGLSLLGKAKDLSGPDDDKVASPLQPPKTPPKSFRKLGDENSMDEDIVTDIFREYQKFADSSETLGRKAFTRLLQVLCPKRTLVDSDLDAWWGQLTRCNSPSTAANPRKALCNFEEFIIWYATSEARTA